MPRHPDFAGQLREPCEPGNFTLSEYKRPDQLPAAHTLVVGAANAPARSPSNWPPTAR